MTKQEAVAIARALSDETRYSILQEIPPSGKKCCKDLSDCFDISKATVTHHINKLRKLGLIEGHKEETYHYLSRNQDKIDEFRDALAEDFVALT